MAGLNRAQRRALAKLNKKKGNLQQDKKRKTAGKFFTPKVKAPTAAPKIEAPKAEPIKKEKPPALTDGENDLNDEFKYKSYKRKEYLTNMLTERAEDVPMELIEAVREAIYNASEEDLDDLEFHVETEYDEDFWKDFYLANNPNLRGRNKRQERIDTLNEVLEFLSSR